MADKPSWWQRLLGKRPKADLPPKNQPPIKIPKVVASGEQSWRVSSEPEAEVDAVFLRQQMSNHLTAVQLDQIATQFDIDPNTLTGGKGRQVLALVTAVSQENKLPQLLTICQKMRQDVNWQL